MGVFPRRYRGNARESSADGPSPAERLSGFLRVDISTGSKRKPALTRDKNCKGMPGTGMAACNRVRTGSVPIRRSDRRRVVGALARLCWPLHGSVRSETEWHRHCRRHRHASGESPNDHARRRAVGRANRGVHGVPQGAVTGRAPRVGPRPRATARAMSRRPSRLAACDPRSVRSASRPPCGVCSRAMRAASARPASRWSSTTPSARSPTPPERLRRTAGSATITSPRAPPRGSAAAREAR